jgi:integral membrane sensor domain MASE1
VSRPRRRTRLAVWILAPLIGVLVGAFAGAVAGSLIGDAMGSPEGEGFIGFIYGLWIGGGVGLAGGAFAAYRFERARRATGAIR